MPAIFNPNRQRCSTPAESRDEEERGGGREEEEEWGRETGSTVLA